VVIAKGQAGREELSAEQVESIRRLIVDHPQAHRRRLSELLCVAWDWRNEQGNYKDMAARRLMLKLHRRGEITLPEQLRPPTNAQRGRGPRVATRLGPEVAGALRSVQPLRLELIHPTSPHRRSFEAWLATHHYLGYRGTVGENLRYLVWSAREQALACLVFEAAAWKVAARDAWLGWSAENRRRHLRWVTNNSRFLILPGVGVPHLASHVLALVTRRLRTDWQAKYGHPVALVETFVERDRFEGCCYRAANWLAVGSTEGRSRNDRRHELKVPVKDIYVYPLHRHFRRQLGVADA
jgi:hypothetical protein